MKLASVCLSDTFLQRSSKAVKLGLPETILLDEQAQRLANDLALVVVETGRDLLLNEALEFWSQVHIHDFKSRWVVHG